MAQILLIPLGQALGGAIGGSIATAIGGAIGAVAGEYINGLLKSPTRTEGPRLKTQEITSSSEGSPMNRLWGRSRMSGNIIWATRFDEEVLERKTGGKGGGGNINTEYSYYMNFAVALCEGPINHIGRIWAAGKEIDQSKYVIRKYLGNETQLPDELIVAKEGSANTPAFRGTAYIVFERLPVADFGSQPQITAEVFRTVGDLEADIQSIALHPDAGEFGFDTLEQSQNSDGEASPENRHVLTAETDYSAAMDELQALSPNAQNITLHPQWFGNDLACGNCEIKPAVRDKSNSIAWGCHTSNRSSAATVTKLFDQPLFGGTPDDAALARAAKDMKARGLGVTLSPKLTLDPAPARIWKAVATTPTVSCWSKDLGRFVGLSSAGVGSVSRDGENWQLHSVPLRNWRSLCWSAELSIFVAVSSDASGGTIWTSLDGYVWLEVSAVAGDWREIIWVEHLAIFVAVGRAVPNVIWSADANSWTAGTADDRNWGAIAYSPELNKFVALDHGTNFVMDSSDGKSFTTRPTSGNGLGVWNAGISWSAKHSLFVTTGNRIADARVMTSADGINYTSQYSLGNTFLYAVSWAESAGLFIAISGTGDSIRVSEDLISWRGVLGSSANVSTHIIWSPELARFLINSSTGFWLSNAALKPALSRLTCDPAFNAPGTPDAGGNLVELISQIDSFFGAATGSEIALSIDAETSAVSTVYSGSDGWTYRRFILHYAKLAAAINAASAGAITTFIIGDGMSGMTRLRASDNPEIQPDYLTTIALISLLSEVRTILGMAVKISYAADTDEYGSLDFGAGRIGYPLDTLWGHSDIDFVGLNAQFPLSDWRDGNGHLDAAAGVTSIYDPEYLRGNVAAGELYDWTYADQAARDAQTRSLITDPVVNKPWVFRQKDLIKWWKNAHYARAAADVEFISATPWTVEAKPIRFTSLICNAVDKSSNEPSALYDPASIDHKRVHYSTGARDDAIQRATLEAVQGYWADPANNPVSFGYGGSMVDLTGMTIGWFDARPASTFPMDGRYWSDADNHEYGSWLTGRLGNADGAGTLKAICDDFGFSAYEISNPGAAVDGITAQGGNSARSVLEGIQPAYMFDAVETLSAIRFQRRGGAVITIDPGDLVAGDGEAWQKKRAQETDLPAIVELSYGEIATDDQTSVVSASRAVSRSDRIQSISLPAVMGASRAKAIVEITLAEIWTGRETMELALPPSKMAVETGDILKLAALRSQWRVVSIADGMARSAQLVRFDARIYTQPRFARRAKYPVGSSPAGAAGSALATPIPFFMDLPLLQDSNDPDAGYLAAYMKPIGNGIAAYRSADSTDYNLDQILPLAAITGVTIASLGKGPAERWDDGNTLDVELIAGELEAASEISVLAGANAAALQQASGEWELIQFANVEIIGTRKYRLTKLLRGQRGSEHAVADPLPSGARFVLLDAGVVQTTLAAAAVGLERTWRVGPAIAAVGDAVFGETTFTYHAKARRPYSPVHLSAMAYGSNDIDLAWIRRSRIGNDSWQQPDVPLGEDSEAYEIDIMNGAAVVRTLASAAQSIIYSEANQITDFGTAQTSLTFNVYQISASFGRGIGASYSGAIT